MHCQPCNHPFSRSERQFFVNTYTIYEKKRGKILHVQGQRRKRNTCRNSMNHRENTIVKSRIIIHFEVYYFSSGVYYALSHSNINIRTMVILLLARSFYNLPASTQRDLKYLLNIGNEPQFLHRMQFYTNIL